jgi:kynurenine formamidase
MADYPKDGPSIQAYYEEHRNWGRWGDDDEAGALNLVTDEKRMEAIGLVQQGRTVSLSRPYPKNPGPRNPNPAQHFMRASIGSQAGGVVDYYGFIYHGYQMTHIDALCHVWEGGRLWNDRDPHETLQSDGARFGDVTAWRQGIVTRGVLLDVVKHRGEPYVTQDRPVHGEELEAIAEAQGIEVRPGDALLVHSGYSAYVTEHPTPSGADSPGLHASCAPFVREHDVAILGWDLMDARPNVEGLRWPMHGVLFNFGVALLDNALLEPLAEACAEEGRYEFMFMAHPLRVEGGTGSPVNPIAMF